MMNIKIKHCYPLCASSERVKRSNGDVVQIAKPHRLRACGVMPWRAHEGKNRLAFPRIFKRKQSCSGGIARHLFNIREMERVCVEVSRHTQPRDVFRHMRSQDGFV